MLDRFSVHGKVKWKLKERCSTSWIEIRIEQKEKLVTAAETELKTKKTKRDNKI